MCIGQIQGHKNQPTFQKTQLGWIVGGKVSGKIFAKSRLCGLSINEQINQNLAKFWEMDQIITKAPFNPEERACMTHFLKTTKRNVDDRFIMQMSFKEAKLQQLGESRNVALD